MRSWATRKRLGELLVSWHVFDDAALDRALQEQMRNDWPLGRMLVSQGLLDEETLAEAISFQSGLPRTYLTLDGVEAQADVLPVISVSICASRRSAARTTDGFASPRPGRCAMSELSRDCFESPP